MKWNDKRDVKYAQKLFLLLVSSTCTTTQRELPITPWDLRSNETFFFSTSIYTSFQPLYPCCIIFSPLPSLCQHSGLYRRECFHLSKISTVLAYFGAKEIEWPTTHRSILDGARVWFPFGEIHVHASILWMRWSILKVYMSSQPLITYLGYWLNLSFVSKSITRIEAFTPGYSELQVERLYVRIIWMNVVRLQTRIHVSSPLGKGQDLIRSFQRNRQ